MDFFDYIISKNDAQEENPGKLSSYRLAKNYFVTGERGEAKKITLPRELVVWE